MAVEAQPLTPEQESAAIAAAWYTLPKPPISAGWLVFSREYILRGLRGDVVGKNDPCSPGMNLVVRTVQACMAVAQAIVMLLAIVPVMNWFVELAAVFFRRGTIGYFLRACYWKTRLGHLGQDTLIDRGVEIWGARNIFIGSRCHLDAYVRMAAGEPKFAQKGLIRIGDYVYIGPRVHLAGRGGLTIRDFAALEAGVHVYSASNQLMHPRHPGQLVTLSHTSPEEFQHIVEVPIEIGEYVVVGLSCLLLPGARLGKGAIVHPYTIVNKPFPPFANVTGPGRATQNGWRRPLRLDPRRQSEEKHPS